MTDQSGLQQEIAEVTYWYACLFWWHLHTSWEQDTTRCCTKRLQRCMNMAWNSLLRTWEVLPWTTLGHSEEMQFNACGLVMYTASFKYLKMVITTELTETANMDTKISHGRGTFNTLWINIPQHSLNGETAREAVSITSNVLHGSELKEIHGRWIKMWLHKVIPSISALNISL